MGGKTSYASKKKYQDKVYDRIGVVVPKGMRDQIKQFATENNKSLNAFIVEAIKKKMERSGNNG